MPGVGWLVARRFRMKRAVIAVIVGDQRSATRRVVNLSAQLVPGGARLCDALIFDISCDGFKAGIHGEVRVGDHAWVQFPGVTPMPCKAVWVVGGDAGFSFVEALSRSALSRIRQSGPRSWPKGHFGPQLT